MEEPAPKGVIHLVDQNTTKFHEDVARHVGQVIGQAVTPQSVNPEDRSPLIRIQQALGNTTHVVGSSFEELVGGADDTTSVRTTGGEVPISIAGIRGLKRRLLEKAA